MTKSELLNYLQAENERWEALLEEIGQSRMEQPGVAADWSMKDIVAHLTGWNRWLVARLQAVARGEPEPAPPWPAGLQTDDEINAWIYEANRARPLEEVLAESRQVFQQLLTAVEGFPEELQIHTLRSPSGREYYFVWSGDQRLPPGELFDHLRDEHEPDLRAWLARPESQ